MSLSTPHILSEIYNRPLLVTAEKLTAILEVLNAKNSGHLELDIATLAPLINAEAGNGAAKAEARPVNEAGDQEGFVQVLDLIGSLIPRNRGFSDSSGLRSYRTLVYEVEQAINNPDVMGLVLDVDSYGGTAQGCARAARVIREASLQKPIYAHIDLNAYSAAYWLASACSRVVLSDADAGVGSIGCLAIHKEISRRAEIEGDTYTIARWGEKKAVLNLIEPLSPENGGKLQASVDQIGEAFAASVAEYRGLDVAKVVDLQAACFSGTEAIDLGLADEIASFADTCAGVVEAGRKQKKSSKSFFASGKAQKTEAEHTAQLDNQQGGNPMSLPEQLSALLEQDGADEALASVLSEKGFVTQAEAGAMVDEAAKNTQNETAKESKAVLIAQMSTAMGLAAMAGLTAAAAKEPVLEALQAEEWNVDSLGESLQAVKAGVSQRKINSTTTGDTKDGKHGLIARAEEAAAQASASPAGGKKEHGLVAKARSASKA